MPVSMPGQTISGYCTYVRNYYYYYQVYGIGPQRIVQKTRTVLRYSLSPNPSQLSKWDKSATAEKPMSLVGIEPLAAQIHYRCSEASHHRTTIAKC